MSDNHEEKDLGTLIEQSYKNADLGKFNKGEIPIMRLKYSIETLVEEAMAGAAMSIQRRVGTQILGALIRSGNPHTPLTKDEFKEIVKGELEKVEQRKLDLDKLTGTGT